MNELKPCPFCGQTIREEFPDFYLHPETHEWHLTHFCRSEEGLSVCMMIYGNTKEEVIERWNHRAEVEKGESL